MSKSWNVDADGTWNVAGNWSGGTLPGSSDDVVISTAHPHTITYTAASGATQINSLFLGVDVLAVTGGTLTVFEGGMSGSGLVTVSASATFDLVADLSTTQNNINITSNAGQVNLFGGTVADTFNFASGALKSNDVLSGGGGFDSLNFTTAGAFAASIFSNVSHIESISLASGSNNLVIPDALVTSADTPHVLYVVGNGGNDIVNGTGVTSTTNQLFVTAGAGNDILAGGAGADSFYFDPLQLTASDIVNGGGTGLLDRLIFTSAGTITTGTLSQVSHIEQILLGNGTNSLTVGDALLSTVDAGHILYVSGGTGNDTVNASGIANVNYRAYITAGTGNDSLTGGAGLDIFYFNAADLTSADSVDGGTGASADIVAFNTAGTVGASAFQNVSHIEQLFLANSGTNNITLTDALVTSADDGHLLYVSGGAGNDTVDGSAVTTVTNRVYFIAGTGNDNLTGGLGADNFYFAAGALNGDFVNGGTGSSIDSILFSSAGTTGAAAFASTSHIEQIVLANGSNFLTLADAMVSSADDGQVLNVIGGTGDDAINGGGVLTATNRLFITAGTGNDTLVGGAGSDTFYFAPSALTSADIVAGGGGNADRIVFTSAGNVSGSAFTQISHVEQILLANGTNSITLRDSMATSSDAGHALTVVGGSGSDQIDGSTVFTLGNSVRLYGGGGADSLFASSGNDVFGYNQVSDSTSTNYDTFHTFDATNDKIDLAAGFTVAGVTDVASGSLTLGTFDSDMVTAIGGALTSHQAVVFHVTGGGFNGSTFLVVNPTGAAGYVAGADYVFDISGSLGGGSYTAADFV